MNLSIVHYANTVSIDSEVVVMGKKANKNIKGEYKKPDFYNSGEVLPLLQRPVRQDIPFRLHRIRLQLNSGIYMIST